MFKEKKLKIDQDIFKKCFDELCSWGFYVVVIEQCSV